MIQTNFKLEMQEQQRWQLRPKYAQVPWFDQLVASEFRTPEQQKSWQEQQLKKVIRFAVFNVPYYHDLFAKLQLSPDDITNLADLQKLPRLSQTTLVEEEKRLRAVSLPKGEKICGYSQSSGTTGKPKRVLKTFKALPKVWCKKYNRLHTQKGGLRRRPKVIVFSSKSTLRLTHPTRYKFFL